MSNAMQAFYNEVTSTGRDVNPRGMDAVAVENTEFEFVPGQVFSRPGMNLNIGFIELLQWIDESFSIRHFENYAPKARLDLFTYDMAYGPRTKYQLERVINELNADTASRRAVMMVASPKDTPETLPCTISLQFQLSAHDPAGSTKLLHTTVTMRSSDLVWGLPTDVIQFGGIAQVVAACTASIATQVLVCAGNSHVYHATRLKLGQEFIKSGSFQVPDMFTLREYKTWAEKCLLLIEKRVVMPHRICGYTPVNGVTKLTASNDASLTNASNEAKEI